MGESGHWGFNRSSRAQTALRRAHAPAGLAAAAQPAPSRLPRPARGAPSPGPRRLAAALGSGPPRVPSRPPAEPRVAATTPRAVLRVKNGAAKLPKPPAAAAAEAPGAGAGMERSQSRLSLSASFEALAIYFPCMNSFDDEDAADSRRLKGAIQRSTETGLAVEMPSRTLRQASHESIEDSMNSYGSEGNLNYGGVCLASDAQFSDFLGSMGPAQFVGRQTLATTPMGDVEIGLQERNGQLEVDIIQARGLTAKPGSKTMPAAYIKAYLLENGVCIAKKKTKVARKSLDPLLPVGKAGDGIVLQMQGYPSRPDLARIRVMWRMEQIVSKRKEAKVIVWGNYGRMERKQFMGVARVLLEELDLTTLAVGWYKLFPTSSMVDPATGPLLRQASQLSLESTVGPCGERS
ncbi:Regulating synaptic membrane exocytosis protein 4 [Microtus ochrogaster]|uniref:Regulating synaptic membrane exocytosis protein 4 n=1 Tax=Microtus ochrogaster TaxID=79684 RepID=A0A8J6FZM5_MICOH|nr:Regulating synaptic membrane exocytosis protein 4 [Microtus ochrogaster]